MANRLAVSSSSGVVGSKTELTAEAAFRWESVRSFVYLAESFGSTAFNFDIFSPFVGSGTLLIFIAILLMICVPYMFVEFFIKQYTGKVTFNKHMNPMLKAINIGFLAILCVWEVNNSLDLTDIVLYLVACFKVIPQFNECHKTYTEHLDGICIDGKNISLLCEEIKRTNQTKPDLETTSSHLYFKHAMSVQNRTGVSKKVFLNAVVWLVNFFLCTLSNKMLAKIFKISYTFRTISMILMTCYIMIWEMDLVQPAFTQVIEFVMSDISLEGYDKAYYYASYSFGVGLIGVYDFGVMSPFTMIDTAVIIFAFSFTGMAIVRSIFVNIVCLKLGQCIALKDRYSYHYILLALLPLASNIWQGSRGILFSTLINLLFTLVSHLAAITYTVAKMLNTEYQSVKLLYLTAIVSFTGFLMSLSLLVAFYGVWAYVFKGLTSIMVFLAFLKMTIVMYLYGVTRLTADVKFWLGFLPNTYWVATFSLLPVSLFMNVLAFIMDPTAANLDSKTAAQRRTWINIIFYAVLGIVAVIGMRIVGKHVANNTLMAIFKAHPKFGPSESADRKRRRQYDEAVTRRTCVHDCMPLDDTLDCTHTPVIEVDEEDLPMDTSATSVFSMMAPSEYDPSIHRLFQASSTTQRARKSDIFDMFHD